MGLQSFFKWGRIGAAQDAGRSVGREQGVSSDLKAGHVGEDRSHE